MKQEYHVEKIMNNDVYHMYMSQKKNEKYDRMCVTRRAEVWMEKKRS